MIRAFVDASVLFSASISPSGGARALLDPILRNEIALIICEEVVEEVYRNIKRKVPQKETVLFALLKFGNLSFVEPLREHMDFAQDLTVAKDVFVVASAFSAKCDYIVSHDRAHLVGNSRIELATGIQVVTPGDLLAIIRSLQTEADAEHTPPIEEHNSEKTQ